MDRGLVNATGRARGRNDAAYPAEAKGAAQGLITCTVTHRSATKMLRPGNSRPPRCGARMCGWPWPTTSLWRTTPRRGSWMSSSSQQTSSHSADDRVVTRRDWSDRSSVAGRFGCGPAG